MPVTVAPYHNDPSIIIYIFYGEWTWEQFYEVDQASWEKYTEANQRVDLILDMSDCDEIPNGLTEILHRVGQRPSDANGGLGVFINAPLTIQVMVRALKRMYTEKSRSYDFVDSFDEAITLIDMNRKSTS